MTIFYTHSPVGVKISTNFVTFLSQKNLPILLDKKNLVTKIIVTRPKTLLWVSMNMA